MIELNWIALTLFYGVASGVRNALRKKALTKSPLVEVLFLYTLLSFLLIAPVSLTSSPGELIFADRSLYLIILLKSLAVFVAWIFSFKSIGKMPVSFFGVVEMSGILFSTLFGMIFFNEKMGIYQWFGLLLVVLGVSAVNLKRDGEKGKAALVPVLMLLTSCLFNSISGTMDKGIMARGDITPGALQFWFMLCMTLLYLVYVIITKTHISLKTYIKNPLIIIMSVIFVLGDRALFTANASPDSRVTVMILLKQSSVVASILMGKLFFGEKHILYRLLCAALITVGILTAAM